MAQRRPLTNHLDVAVIKDLLEKKFKRVELPKHFLPVSIRGEVGKGVASVPWSPDGSDDAIEVGSVVATEEPETNGL